MLLGYRFTTSRSRQSIYLVRNIKLCIQIFYERIRMSKVTASSWSMCHRKVVPEPISIMYQYPLCTCIDQYPLRTSALSSSFKSYEAVDNDFYFYFMKFLFFAKMEFENGRYRSQKGLKKPFCGCFEP